MSMDDFVHWVRFLTDEDRDAIFSHHLGNIAHLFHVRIDYNLLACARHCWDPDSHVFRFGRHNELCPTVEEYSRILGTFSNDDLIEIPPCGYSRFDFNVYLGGVNENSFPSIHCSKGVHIGHLARIFFHATEPVTRGRALCLCLMGYLLFRYDGVCFNRSVALALQGVRARKALIPLVLGETFDFLDGFMEGPVVGGSPALLYIWLVEHLRLIDPLPEVLGSAANVVRIFNLRQLYHWAAHLVLNNLRGLVEEEIRWHLSDLGIALTFTRTQNHNVLTFTSLTRRTFYCPQILYRQFGYNQGIPQMHGHFFGVTSLTNSIVRATRVAWQRRDGYRLLRRDNEIQEAPICLPNYTDWRDEFLSFEGFGSDVEDE